MKIVILIVFLSCSCMLFNGCTDSNAQQIDLVENKAEKKVDVASSLSKTQASLVLHSFIATFTGNSITKYSGVNTVAKYMNKQGIVKSISTRFPTELAREHRKSIFPGRQRFLFRETI